MLIVYFTDTSGTTFNKQETIQHEVYCDNDPHSIRAAISHDLGLHVSSISIERVVEDLNSLSDLNS